MKRVLITGMSGTGKSALLEELAARGHRAVDTDEAEQVWFETVGGERLWRVDRIEELLRSEPGEPGGLGAPGGPGGPGELGASGEVLFVQGTTRNQGRFYPWFDAIVLLSAPTEVLVERLRTRTSNPYGKDPAELAEILGHLETVEPLLRASATLEVVTTVPVPAVADAVLAHVLREHRAG